jgi:RND family efflux transporter MFP subunit
MSTNKTSLDALRIDRSAIPAKETSWAPVVIVLLLIGGGLAWWMLRDKSPAVQTATAREQVISSSSANSGKAVLNASGYVTARRAATISSKITGKVTEVLVEEGMKVELDQVLARLDPAQLDASLRLAEAQREAIRKSIDEIAPTLKFALEERERMTGLIKTGAASDSDVRRAEAEASLQTAKLERQKAELISAERQVDTWKQQLDDATIRAPFAGIVTSKNAQPGEVISPMSSGGFTRTGICTVVDMSSLEIQVDVSESYINRVQAEQPVEATLDAYSDWKIPAKVIAIIPTADRQKATVKVRIGFVKLDPRILPEMAVKVAFLNAAVADALAKSATQRSITVPKSAVQNSNGRDVVWIIRDGKLERRAVSTGTAVGDDVAITAGIAAGETVALNPASTFVDGAKITASKP